MKLSDEERLRPDMVAAARGGDPSQSMDGEADLESASMEQALYWRQIYREILAMEEKVMERIQDLMSKQSPEARSEVDTLGGYLVIRAGHVPVRGELVPGPGGFEAEVLDADPRRVKRVKIYRRQDRRNAPSREVPQNVKALPLRPAAPRDETNRPTSNAPRSP